MQRIKKLFADFRSAVSSFVRKTFSRKKSAPPCGPSFKGKLKGRFLALAARTLSASVDTAAAARRLLRQNRNAFDTAARQRTPLIAENTPSPPAPKQ